MRFFSFVLIIGKIAKLLNTRWLFKSSKHLRMLYLRYSVIGKAAFQWFYFLLFLSQLFKALHWWCYLNSLTSK